MIDLGHEIPIPRIFDVAKAREFYGDFLGFAWDWEHRFKLGLPVYAQVSRASLLLHLSEHFGDGTPGTRVRLTTRGLDALDAELAAKRYRHARPGIQPQPWGWRELAVSDPFGNVLIFAEEDA